MDVTEGERLHNDYAVPLEFHIGTGTLSGDTVVIVDLRLVVPTAPEIGEQRAVLVLGAEDAMHMAEVLKEVGESIPPFTNSNEAAVSAGEENSK